MGLMLVADIGGTNCRFYLAEIHNFFNEKSDKFIFPTKNLTFQALLEVLMTKCPQVKEKRDSIKCVFFAVAGQICGDSVQLTNGILKIDKKELKKYFPNALCCIINDFEAQAWDAISPFAKDLILLHGSKTENNYPIAVVGAGTGLGTACAILPNEKSNPIILKSEAGHSPFAFINTEEIRFGEFVKNKRNIRNVTYEHILSGSGLELLYEYMTGTKCKVSDFTQKPEFALSDCCEQFARFYGRYCRQMALAFLSPTIVITGGVAEKTPCLIKHRAFYDEFLRAEDCQKNFLQSCTILQNVNPLAGLRGAYYAGLLALR